MILNFLSVEEIRFIDCEHMGYNYAGFDIAHLYVGITSLEPGSRVSATNFCSSNKKQQI